MEVPEWEIAFVLPNLTLPAHPQVTTDKKHEVDLAKAGLTLDTADFAIVSHADDRVLQIRRAYPAAERLLSSFVDAYDETTRVSVLIVRRAAKLRPGAGGESVVAFRNAIAISVVLRARAASMRGSGSGMSPSWSDTFDFYPTTVNDQGRLVTISPALVAGFSEDAPHRGSPSPHVAAYGERLYADLVLLRHLSYLWRRRFAPPFTNDLLAARVFRSLEVAYLASSVASKNQGSIHEYGVQVALWVSALEILSWPFKKRASKESTIDLLARYEWSEPRLSRRRYEIQLTKGHSRRVNLVQKLCDIMYAARNTFLHGNRIQKHTLLPVTGKRGLSLPMIGAVVYRTALVAAFFGRPHAHSHDLVSDTIEEMLSGDYGDALEQIVSLKRMRRGRNRKQGRQSLPVSGSQLP